MSHTATESLKKYLIFFYTHVRYLLSFRNLIIIL